MIAYLSDPVPVAGPGPLIGQLEEIRRVAMGRSIDRYVVDSGSGFTPAGRGPSLEALIAQGRDGGGGGVLAVAAVRRLGRDRAACRLAIADLLRAGFVLKDSSGELHPDAATVELAAAACEPARKPATRKSAPRRARGDAGRGHA